MTPEEAAFVLEPIYQGFAAALHRIHVLMDRLDRSQSGAELARQINDLLDAIAYLETVMSRNLCSESGGLMTVYEHGKGIHAWPNAYPETAARIKAEIAYHARRIEREMNEKPITALKQSA